MRHQSTLMWRLSKEAPSRKTLMVLPGGSPVRPGCSVLSPSKAFIPANCEGVSRAGLQLGLLDGRTGLVSHVWRLWDERAAMGKPLILTSNGDHETQYWNVYPETSWDPFFIHIDQMHMFSVLMLYFRSYAVSQEIYLAGERFGHTISQASRGHGILDEGNQERLTCTRYPASLLSRLRRHLHEDFAWHTGIALSTGTKWERPSGPKRESQPCI